jgi:hypothetical protein
MIILENIKTVDLSVPVNENGDVMITASDGSCA